MFEEIKEYDSQTHFLTLSSFINIVNEQAESIMNEDCAFIYINVPNFKIFNQNYGFAEGDKFLHSLSVDIKCEFSDSLIARVSGDRFLVYKAQTDEDEVRARLGRVQESMTDHQKTLSMHINSGIFINDRSGKTPSMMIDCAKLACDFIEDDLNVFTMRYSGEIEKELTFRHYIITGFDNATKQHYIQPWYQCEVRTLTRKICGYEALARWIDPEYGMISPDKFVPILENAKLIHRLDLCIIEQVCRDIRAAIDRGLEAQPVSVNLSRMDFILCDIFAEVDTLVKKYNVPVELIHIEITEGAFAFSGQTLRIGADKFKSAGYEIWLDDFGSGFSSLNNLQSYQFNLIKIDREFLKDMTTNSRSRIILASVINMVKTLKMHTLAEGIETEEDYEFLLSIGCEKMQGYLFGKPRPNTPDAQLDENYELTEYHDYYEKMGEINVISSAPFDTSSTRIFSDEPLAICEITGERLLSYVYYNDAFKSLLDDLGINSREHAEERSKEKDMRENDMFFDLARKAEKSGRIETAEIIINGTIINERLKFLTRKNDRAIFLLASISLSSQKILQQAENIQESMQHILTLYFRVDLYDDDGTVENIYLNSIQGRITDENTDAVEAVRMYSERYLPEDERERFRAYYDMKTVKDRLKKTDGSYLSDYYHSIMPGDEGRMQIYMIVPFKIRGRQKYLSLCRYVHSGP